MACGETKCEGPCYECDCQHNCRTDSEVEDVAACLEECDDCAVLPAVAWLIDGFGDGFDFDIPCPALETFGAAVDDCNGEETDALADCAEAEDECITDCAGDTSCVDLCKAGKATCEGEAGEARIDCITSAWGSVADLVRACAEKTVVEGEPLETCCGGEGEEEEGGEDPPPPRFSRCLELADDAYIEAVWPKLIAFRDEVWAAMKEAEGAGAECESTFWTSMSSCDGGFDACFAGCAGNPVCEAACLATLESCAGSANTARGECQTTYQEVLFTTQWEAKQEFAEKEEEHGSTRQSARATCIGNLLGSGEEGRPLYAICHRNYLANLKRRDLSAEAERFGVMADLFGCLSACPAVEFGGDYGDFFTCRGLCNLEAEQDMASLDTDRMTGRMLDCRGQFRGAANNHARAECLLGCEAMDLWSEAACARAHETCIVSCCALGGEELEDCQTQCDEGREECLNGGASDPVCAPELETCLDGCKATLEEPQDETCVIDCRDTFVECMLGYGAVSPIFSSRVGEHGDCVDACEELLFGDCPSCVEDAQAIDNELLCLPESFWFHRAAPQVEEASCD